MERIFCTSPCSAFFSFREMTVGNAIDFWLEFLGTLGLVPDHVTIHPDRLMEWTPLYRGGVAIVADPECTWSDGSISGYCTEFYKHGVETGHRQSARNLHRRRLWRRTSQLDRQRDAARRCTIVQRGYRPGNKEQGYVLRKLLRRIHKIGGTLTEEVERQKRLRAKYLRLRDRHAEISPDWWFDTHGIDFSELGETLDE